MRLFKRRYPRSLLVLVATLVYIAWFVTPQWLNNFHMSPLPINALLAHQAMALFMVFVQTYCLLFALTILRAACLTLMPLLWALTALSVYMMRMFNAQISRDSIAAALEATSGEVSAFMNLSLIGCVAAGFAAGLLAAGLIVMRERKEAHNIHTATLAILFAGLSVIQSRYSELYPPYNLLFAASEYAMLRVHQATTARTDIAAAAGDWRPANQEAPVIVLVIGESARADHFGLNGYRRDTTPLLVRRTNVVNFSNATSCGVFTRIAVPCMLTRATRENQAALYGETSIVGVFRKLGFYTAWISAQGAFSAADPTTDILSEANEHTLLLDKAFMNNTVLDEQLLPLMDRVLAAHPGPLFIVLHTLGSHWQYAARYPAPFEHYKPVCAANTTPQAMASVQENEIRQCPEGLPGIINAYDNTILYTDYILDQIITRLEPREAMMAYISDHGESLGEDGRFLHGHPEAPENYHVPMIWWASDAFLARHRAEWNNLRANAALPVRQDDLFSSLLDCAGARTQLIDPKRSLCTPYAP